MSDTAEAALSAARFLAAVELEPAEPENFDQAFTAVTQYVPWPKAYGGDLVAQAAMAAMRSVDSDRELHSMHSYFMRPADILQPLRYEVEHLRDGRSYSTRQVRAYQNGKVVYAALSSFHVSEEGPEFAAELPLPYRHQLPQPEDLPSSGATLAGVEGPAADYWGTGRSFDMRHVSSPVYLQSGAERLPHQAVWIKAFGELPDDPHVQRAALAYVCDYTILEPVLREQGSAWADAGLVTASLDHSMWFHREGRMDEWVLYVQEAVSTQHSRGLATGHFYTREGVLLATVAQEGMIRKLPPK
ncbi:acyl-CoA thioesterase II [Cryobacterium sp. TMT1-2-2]|uniref:acyl-CoA thioesterase n=1 Tax=Cryobacterium sp. TMT1-2-2 TaxID=1259233 RepID=UPI00106D108E|nr:acyl-CoA thioesterase domain-containing protein [Cryobacterium sp. TMT1-2-2]TFD12240.1 acyl-CoA thioesterase II [Cryobacterium sp. TMT1-2-2]